MIPDPAGTRGRLAVALLAALTFLFLALILRGQNFHIMGDEYLYSFDAQFTPPSEATYPVWLYLKLFGAVGRAGEGFYQAARLLNAALFAASAYFIYATARHHAGPGLALLVAALAVLGPVNSLAAYFMPDATYFLMFWVVSWFVLTRSGLPALRYGAGAGALMALAALVKPHGLLLLLIFLGLQGLRWLLLRSMAEARHAAAVSAAAVAGFLLVRLGLGYAFAGPRGLGLIGGYAGINDMPMPGAARLLELVAILSGLHAATILVWAAPAVAVLAGLLFSLRRQPEKRADLVLYTVLCGFTLVAVSVLFTARIADTDGLRTHARYYDAALPLLAICAASRGLDAVGGRVPRILALLIAAAVAMLPAAFAGRTLHLVDNPEIAGLLRWGSAVPWIFGGMAALCCLAVALRPRLGARLYLGLLLPGLVLVSGSGAHALLRIRTTEIPMDTAARVTRDRLGADAARLSVAAELPVVMASRFAINRPGPGDVVLNGQGAVQAAQVPAASAWLLVVGPAAAPPGWSPVAGTPGEWSLLRRD
jgi:phosphoglycerol transferase